MQTLKKLSKTIRYVALGAWGVGTAFAAEPYDALVNMIEIPKTAWFDTGYVVKDNPRVTMRFMVPHTTSSDGDLFGTGKAANDCFILNMDTGKFCLRYGTGNATSMGSFEADTPYEIVCDQTLVVDGETVGTVSSPGSFATNTGTMRFPDWRRRPYRDAFTIGAFKLEDGGSNVCDMVACRKDGVLGFYDKIADRFVAMSGTGELKEIATANTCYWTGAAGTDRLDDAGNWANGVAPLSGRNDKLVFTNDVAIAVSNAAPLSVASMCFAGGARVELAGERITLTSGVPWNSESNSIVVCRLPLTFADGTAYFCASATFYGDITCTGTGNLILQARVKCPESHGAIHFYGTFTAPSATVYPQATSALPIHFHAPVRVKQLYNNTTESNSGYNYVYAPMEYTLMNVSYRHYSLMAPDVLCPTAGISWVGYAGGGRIHAYYDQTCGELESPKTAHNSTMTALGDNRVLNLANESTLTIRAQASKTTYAVVYGNGTLCYAPPDAALVQTFSSRTNSLSGALVVSNGTVRLTDGEVWRQLKRLVVFPTGKLEIDAANGVANPFPDLESIAIRNGGELVLPADVKLTASAVCVEGTRQADATYGDVDWISGGGSVIVSNVVPANTVLWETSAASGDWSTASNWLPQKVPDVTLPAVVAVDGAIATQTVTVATAAAPATNLTASCASPFSGAGLVFDVTALWPFSRAWLSFGARTAVNVKDGGRLILDDRAATTGADERFLFKQGAQLNIASGGFVSYTNAQGRLAARGQGVQGAPSAINIAEGGTCVCMPVTAAAVLALSDGARMNVAGRLRLVHTNSASAATLLAQNGGDIVVSGNGVFEIFNQGNVPGCLTFGTGTTRFTDDARMTISGGTHYARQWNVQPSAADETAEVIFDGNSGFTGTFGPCSLGTAAYAGTTRLTVGGNASLNPSETLCSRVYVGGRYGTTLLDLGSGRLAVGSYGLRVGSSIQTTVDCASEGTLAVSNGAALIVFGGNAISRGGANSSIVPLTEFIGTEVGTWLNAAQNPTQGTHPIVGRLTVDGANSSFKSQRGHFIVGAGKAEGTVAQSGGTVNVAVGQDAESDSSNSNSDKSVPSEQRVYFKVYVTNNVMAVGLLGGRGTVAVTGGAFTSNLRTFVGGCHTNEWYDGGHFKYGTGACVANSHDAEGTLRVTGGAFSCTKRVIVGSDGSGALEVGPAGSFSAETLVLSNQTASVLRLGVDANGRAGAVTVTNLVIAAGAKLEVDLGTYAEHKRVMLVRAASIEGAFGDDDVTFTGTLAPRSFLRRMAAGIAVQVGGDVGTCLIFR